VSEAARRELLVRELESVHNQLKQVGMRSRIVARSDLTLTPQQVRVAGLLVLNGPMRSSELALALEVSRATVTGLLDRLEQAGLVVRRVDPHDNRGRLAEVTDSGRQALSELLSSMSLVQDRVLEALTADELAHLVAGFRAVLRVARSLDRPD
jgi:DNA-binding MarR family transcriptional regulator